MKKQISDMNQNQIMRVGIVGAGWIAEKAAITLQGMNDCEAYAIASRSLEKAADFARKWHISKAYGSYADLIADPDVDLVYVATPHSHHYDVTRAALLAGQPCLVEKAFMANARQAKDIIYLAHERGVFLAEAIWTRYQHLGVYALNFVRMFTDADIVTCDGHCVKTDTGMDLTNAITIVLSDGLLEPREMPHRETLYIMQLMDDLRAKWGVRYPMD